MCVAIGRPDRTSTSTGDVLLMRRVVAPQSCTRQSCKRTRSAIRVVLAGYLALWFGLSPILQAAHLVTSDHAHRFCEEHHRFEDVARGQGIHETMAGALSGRRPAASSLAAAPSAPRQPHVACAILNHCTSLDPLLPFGRASASAELDQHIVRQSRRQESFLSCPLLLTAPKTSPPLVAA